MTNSNKILVIFSLVALILILFCIFPILGRIKASSDALILAKNNIVSLNAETTEIEKFKANYDLYKPNFEKIDQLFIDPADLVNFIKFLEDAAGKYQITSQISLQSQQSNQDYVIFQFSSTGQFSQIKSFAKEIEAGKYLIEVENLTIQNSTDIQDKAALKDYSSRKVSAVFTIKAFTKK